MSKEPVHVFLGDLHAGSKLAPLVRFTDSSKQTTESQIGAALAGFLSQALSEVKDQAKGHRLVLHLGGDLVDGVQHHGSTQTFGTHKDQRDLAVLLLKPWTNSADAMYGLLGTEAHTGAEGEEDQSVCEALGVKAEYQWTIESGGKRLDWAHHCTIGRKAWTREGPLVALANDTGIKYARRKEPLPPPDLIVRHHVHQYVHTRTETTQVVTVPGWQAQTSFTRRIDPNGLLTVGVVLWWPKRDQVRPLLYDFPAEPVVKVSYAKTYKRPAVVAR